MMLGISPQAWVTFIRMNFISKQVVSHIRLPFKNISRTVVQLNSGSVMSINAKLITGVKQLKSSRMETRILLEEKSRMEVEGDFEIYGNKLGFSQDETKFNLGKFIMESFYLDENCLKYSASTIASTVEYIVMKYFKMPNYKDCYNKKLFNIKKIDEFETKYSKSNNYAIHIIKECAKDICYCINELPRGNLKSTLRKYSNERFGNVTKLLYGNLEGNN